MPTVKPPQESAPRTRPRSRPNSRAPSRIDPGVSEFGACMAKLLVAFPHAWGAVLSDGQGEPIDAARRVEAIEAIDVQIAGAQIGQCLARTQTSTTILGLGPTLGDLTVIVEADLGLILARPILDEYLFTLIASGAVSLARALGAFEDCALELLTHME